MDPFYLQPQRIAVLDDAPRGGDACALPRRLWERLINQQKTEVLLVSVSQYDREPTLLHVSSPHSGEPDEIYLPEALFVSLDPSEYITVTVVEEMPPLATKITLKPLQPELADGIDLSSAVSEHLLDWHVLKQGTILTVAIQELGNYELDILVGATEPQECVLLRGEVPLELDVPKPEGIYRPPTPRPSSPAKLVEAEEDDYNTLVPIAQPAIQSKFTPFSGTGYRLGGS